MTAIGLALLILAILVSLSDDEGVLPEWACAIVGVCQLAGMVLTLAGALTFVWEGMP